MSTILIVLLILALVGVIPVYGYNNQWGYGPSGFLTVVLIVMLILVVTGKI